ncbi:MAG: hypothetical protein ACLFPL_03265 [Candidatus Nanoarchaeia archaeon]
MSIFNFRRKADEPYELGERIGKGSTYDFYHIKGRKRLGVKICNGDYSRPPTDDIILEEFEKEIEIVKLLRRNNIPVPRYVGIIDVFNSEKKEFVKGLVIEIIGDETQIIIFFDIEAIDSSNNTNFSIDEFTIAIDNGKKRIIEKEIEHKICEKYKNGVCNTLNLIINNFKISKKELSRRLDDWDFQGLYSSKSEVFYVIDFELWELDKIKKILH